ncbi:MAG: TIGR00341 family protein [Actinomycetes bacterium]
MALHLTERVLPARQRRTLEELTADLDLNAGDSQSKQSAFWTMLVLSAVIATAGVVADSTATVIGAMIIAPLSTPIMGVALGIVRRSTSGTRRAAVFTFTGASVVILIGIAFSLVVPGGLDLLNDSQIASRTSPGLVDLISAVATGFAGAVAFARRDVAAVLPGVAIAISLVPPLAVVGVCLGQGSVALAAGALVLFLSNFVALVLAGTLVFTSAGYAAEAGQTEQLSRRRAYLAIGTLLFVVLVPMAVNTVGSYLIDLWTQRVQSAADQWIADQPGASVQSVTVVSQTIYVNVQTPGDVPPTDELVSALDGQIPNGIPVVVTTTVGQHIDAGVVGGAPAPSSG